MSTVGGLQDRKRIRISGERAACVVRALAEAQGLVAVAEGDVADLAVLEVESAEDLRGERRTEPVVAVVGRRLRDGEAKALREAGASAVIDAESSVLDVAFAISDLLFGNRVQQRRYRRIHGGLPVRVRTLDEDSLHEGLLVDLARAGAFVRTEAGVAEGALIELEVEMLDRVVPLRGRVVYQCEDREGVAIEFALGDGEVAPKLFALCDDVPALAGEAAPRRAPVRAALSSAR